MPQGSNIMIWSMLYNTGLDAQNSSCALYSYPLLDASSCHFILFIAVMHKFHLIMKPTHMHFSVMPHQPAKLINGKLLETWLLFMNSSHRITLYYLAFVLPLYRNKSIYSCLSRAKRVCLYMGS